MAPGADDAALERAAELLSRIGESDGLLVEARPEAEAFLTQAAGRPGLAQAVQALRARQEQAATTLALEARVAALRPDEDGRLDEPRLQEALARWPKDQALVTARAELLRDRGDADGARAALEALGPVGLRIAAARRLTAELLADADQLPEAEAILRRYLAERLPAYQAARKAFAEQAKGRENQLWSQAEAGELPRELERKLEPASEAQRQELVRAWIDQALRDDPLLARARLALEATDDVVPAALTLGTVELRRAAGASSEERQALLEEAERDFLAIRDQGEDLPAYHLGLGQVYHRLGKAEQGEQELSALLKSEDWDLHLAVVRAYRELGLIGRAREVAKDVLAKGTPEAHSSAAISLSIMATEPADKERWLAQAATDQPEVRIRLTELRAQRLLDEGKLAQAEPLFAEAEAYFQSSAAHDATAANNAALAAGNRYLCTGDPRHLDRSATLLEGALQLEPQDAVVVHNLARLHQQRANLHALGSVLHTRPLHIEEEEAESLMATLLGTDLRPRLQQALRTDPAFRRALELTRRQQVLMPDATDAYERERGWCQWLDDLAGLRDLAARVRQAGQFDTAQAEEARAHWTEGKTDRDAARLSQIQARLTALEAVLREPALQGHKPTAAAAHLLRAELLDERALLKASLTDARAAASEAARAASLWPEAGLGESRADKLLSVAVLATLERNPAWAAAWSQRFRAEGFGPLLFDLAQKDAAFRLALAGQPELAEAARALRPPGPATSLGSWLTAHLAGDRALEGRLSAALRDDLHTANRAALELLDPPDDDEPSPLRQAALQPE